MEKKNVLVTGANGFVGFNLVRSLYFRNQYNIYVAVNKVNKNFHPSITVHDGLDLSKQADWNNILSEMDIVIHCAARAHITKETSLDPIHEFRKINTDATLNLARQADQSGVKRFIFLSSIGVNGSETTNYPFKVDDIPKPHSAYAQSKLEAEIGLLEVSKSTGMSVVIIRSPLVYGPGAPGNFGSLVKLIIKQMPMPFGRVRNKRSFVFLDNLIDLIVLCMTHPRAAHQIFLVSDDEDLSTSDFFQKIANAFGKSIILLPFPISILNFLAKMCGEQKMAQQLLGSLQVDIEKTRTLLDWRPPFGIDEALRRTAEGYTKNI
jgi:nucleoside-diphosphate-sugar epimerase